MNRKIVELEKAHKFRVLSSKRSPVLWQSWSVKGLTEENQLKYTGKNLFMSLKLEEFEYLVDSQDFAGVQSLIENQAKKDLNIFKEAEEKCLKASDGLIDFCKENSKKDFAGLSNAQISLLFNEYIERLSITAPFRAYILILSRIVSDLINEEINKIKSEGVDVDFHYEYLTPSKELPFVSMQKSLAAIGAKMEQENLSLESEVIRNLLDKHLEKYHWLTTHRYFGEALTSNDLEKNIKEKLGGFKQYLDNLDRENNERNAKLDKVKSINNNLRDLLNMAQAYAYFLTYRLDIVNEAVFYSRNMLLEIGKRTGISYDGLLYLTYEEILSLLAGKKIDFDKLIKARQEYYVIYLVNGNEVYIFEGLDNKFVHETAQTRVDILKGKVAQRGRIQGTVKVVKSKQEINKLEKGDIIVCPMTMPEMIVGLIKCAGIITDEGGIACHAAQISRELKVPCIIGTGNASKILQDGDIVEIIAESMDGEVWLK